jgi:hypothetical protein
VKVADWMERISWIGVEEKVSHVDASGTVVIYDDVIFNRSMREHKMGPASSLLIPGESRIQVDIS